MKSSGAVGHVKIDRISVLENPEDIASLHWNTIPSQRQRANTRISDSRPTDPPFQSTESPEC